MLCSKNSVVLMLSRQKPPLFHHRLWCNCYFKFFPGLIAVPSNRLFLIPYFSPPPFFPFSCRFLVFLFFFLELCSLFSLVTG